MQFGKLQGLLLVSLGIILILLQLFLYKTSATPTVPSTGSPATAPHQRVNPVSGIVGALALIGGTVIYFTGRRNDQPAPKDAVK